MHRKTPVLESQLKYSNSVGEFPEFQSDNINQKFQNNILKIIFAP